MKHKILQIALCLTLAGCAGFSRSCSSDIAVAFGANWLVVQYRYDGEAMRCWKLSGTSVENETGSDGIYWKSPEGHLVHISGWYNRVQVAHEDWAGAASSLGVDLKKCGQ